MMTITHYRLRKPATPPDTLLRDAMEALAIFAADESWRVNGICDPNSGAFEGQSIAAAIRDRAEKAGLL